MFFRKKTPKSIMKSEERSEKKKSKSSPTGKQRTKLFKASVVKDLSNSQEEGVGVRGGLSFGNGRQLEEQRAKLQEELINNSNTSTNGSQSQNTEDSAMEKVARKLTSNPTKKRGISLTEKQKKENSKYKFLTFKMYSYKIFNWLLQGSLDRRDPNLNGSQIQVGYASVITKKTITRYYAISYLPEETPVAFYNHVKRAFDSAMYWVKVSMQMNNRPFFVDLSKTGIQLKLLRWTQQLQEEDDGEIEGADGTRYVTNLGQANQRKFTKRMLRSYFKIRDNNRHLNETTTIIKLQTRDEEDMRVAHETLIEMLELYGIDYKPITGKLLDFLRTFSIVSKQRKSSYNATPRLLMTNRDLADMTPMKQGKIGWWGIFFGIDKFSGCAVWIDLMNTSDAKNILITAITGFGKSFYLSFQLMFHKAVGNRIFIQDYKGTEFVDFTKSVGGLVVSQTPSKTSFINKWRIPTGTDFTEKELRGFYTESIGLAMIEFMTIVSPDEKDKKVVNQVFNDFLRFVHRKADIETNNVSTYANSAKITPEYLYECYEAFSGPQSSGIIQMYGERLLLSIKNDLFNYYHKEGSRHELFENEIDMEEVLNAEVVCFDFGMQETTDNAVPDNELKLKQLNYETVSSRYTAYNKKRGLTTVKVTEEIQSADEDLLKFTASDVSRGRSKNMINYILGNSSGVLFQDNRYSKTIKDGINIMVLGKMHAGSIRDYTDEFQLHDVEEDLKKIATSSDYKRCFLLHCTLTKEPITTVVEMVTTPEVAESSYFRTVDHKGNEGVGIS